METARQNAPVVLVEQQYQEMEVWVSPSIGCARAGCKVTPRWPGSGSELSEQRWAYPAKSEKAAKDVSADDFGHPGHPRRFSRRTSYAADAGVPASRELRWARARQGRGGDLFTVPGCYARRRALKGRKATCFFCHQGRT